MTRTLLPDNALNGGFPEPPPTEPVRVVAARHAACGESTRVRLPGSVPARAVRRLRCSACAQAFDAERVEELGIESSSFPSAAAEPVREPSVEAAKLVVPQAMAKPVEAPRPFAHKPTPLAAALTAAAGPGAISTRLHPQPTPAATAPATVAPASPVEPAEPERSRSLPKLAIPSLPSLPKLALPAALRRKPAAERPAPATPAERPAAKWSLPGFDPNSRAWKLASVGIAAVAVIALLMVLQGGDSENEPSVSSASEIPEATGSSAAPISGGSGGEGDGGATGKSQFISGATYSLLLPKGWEEVEGSGGATFSAVAPDGSADATLWISEDPKLEFPEFVSNSMTQLEGLAGSAEVIERVPAPSADDSIVKLGADSPPGEPAYEVLLRAAGPYRYYLAFTLQPDAPSDVIEGKDLIEGSFTPEAKG